ncbi:3-deoxy-manno-octulosonate cytidylyltransferase [Candidatus Poribacteria bacterium]|nr:3-deoxy-manno-octulosonate cytidylyltransferase [Candidatus Poribacteria bacterium]
MSRKPSVLGVIPARYASTRFPGKPLADIVGKPMIQHVYERSLRAKLVNRVLVATDDDRIYDAVLAFGGEAHRTGECPTGTHRVAVTSAAYPEYDIVLNIQGDEPLLEPAMLDALVEPFVERPELVMTTLAEKIVRQSDYESHNVVKVVCEQNGLALYFSRASMPGSRDGSVWSAAMPALRHIGLYGYRQDFLARLIELPPTPLEQHEGLEQLRAVENGYRIHVSVTPYATIGVDTPDELEMVASILRSRGV